MLRKDTVHRLAWLHSTRAENRGMKLLSISNFIPRLFRQNPIPAQCSNNKPQIGGGEGRKNNTQVLQRESVVINAALQRTGSATFPMARGCQVNGNEKYNFYLPLTAAPTDPLFGGETWKKTKKPHRQERAHKGRMNPNRFPTCVAATLSCSLGSAS